MSNEHEHKDHEHHDHEHKEHHSAHEHSGGHSKQEKILGFDLKVVVLVFALVIIAALAGTWFGAMSAQASAVSAAPQVSAADTALLKANVESYINKNFLEPQGLSAKILDANDLGNGLYALSFEVYQNGTKADAGVIYANKSNLIIGQVFDLNKPIAKPATTTPAQTAPVKSDKPQVDLYVMSFCPYGNQAEDTMISAYSLLKDKIDFNVHFIVSVSGTTVQSLHGANEVLQDEREACVLKNYGNGKWFQVATYVNDNCGSATGASCWADALTKAGGIDANKIDSCVATEGVALMSANELASNAAGANGSPTLVINGVKSNAVYQYGNSEAYKTAICDAFNTAPTECATKLSAATTAPAGSCNPSP
ncbi:Uncharacterised protein [uncultured archaeon]|nr:Uncharacterised protein [uncultured archaeon]